MGGRLIHPFPDDFGYGAASAHQAGGPGAVAAHTDLLRHTAGNAGELAQLIKCRVGILRRVHGLEAINRVFHIAKQQLADDGDVRPADQHIGVGVGHALDDAEHLPGLLEMAHGDDGRIGGCVRLVVCEDLEQVTHPICQFRGEIGDVLRQPFFEGAQMRRRIQQQAHLRRILQHLLAAQFLCHGPPRLAVGTQFLKLFTNGDGAGRMKHVNRVCQRFFVFRQCVFDNQL